MPCVARDAEKRLFCGQSNNPTGTCVSSDWGFHSRRAPMRSWVDEAIRNFCATHWKTPALIERIPTWFVMRTLFKAQGLAGLRIGYGLA